MKLIFVGGGCPECFFEKLCRNCEHTDDKTNKFAAEAWRRHPLVCGFMKHPALWK
jgi:cobyrinic acid a,c-diamide synthase